MFWRLVVLADWKTGYSRNQYEDYTRHLSDDQIDRHSSLESLTAAAESISCE